MLHNHTVRPHKFMVHFALATGNQRKKVEMRNFSPNKKSQSFQLFQCSSMWSPFVAQHTSKWYSSSSPTQLRMPGVTENNVCDSLFYMINNLILFICSLYTCCLTQSLQHQNWRLRWPWLDTTPVYTPQREWSNHLCGAVHSTVSSPVCPKRSTS